MRGAVSGLALLTPGSLGLIPCLPYGTEKHAGKKRRHLKKHDRK